MTRIALTTELCRLVAAACRIKAATQRRARRRATATVLHTRQANSLERRLAAAVAPVLRRQVAAVAAQVAELTETAEAEMAALAIAPSKEEFYEQLIDAAMPPMAKAMGDAGWAELLLSGADLAVQKAIRVKFGEKAVLRSDLNVQAYSRRNELMLARRLGAATTEITAPIDIIWKDGRRQHGIEMKTLVWQEHDKLKVGPEAKELKEKWERETGGIVHTVIFDDRGVIPGNTQAAKAKALARFANGDKRGFDSSKRKVYYKRGYGSFRLGGMTLVRGVAALKKAMRAGGKSQPTQTKVSTATQWLANTGIETPPGLSTELPDWMVASIEKELAATFQEPYWRAIVAETTKNDIEQIIGVGLQEGLGARGLAKKIKETLGTEYYRNRALAIARTEASGALNGARRASMDALAAEVGPELPMRASWLSVLGTTTRASHANLDGVPADDNGMFNLGGQLVPYPGHRSLPARERMNCQCSVTNEFGLQPDTARRLVAEYAVRVEEFDRREEEEAARKVEKPKKPPQMDDLLAQALARAEITNARIVDRLEAESD